MYISYKIRIRVVIMSQRHCGITLGTYQKLLVALRHTIIDTAEKKTIM